MDSKASLHAVISGHVQGVFYRAFVVEQAGKLEITGFVRNLPNGSEVEVQAEGDKNKLEKLLESLNKGPSAAQVEKVSSNWGEYRGKYSSFRILY